MNENAATVTSAIEAMKKGAFDFLPKPFNPVLLKPTTDYTGEGREDIVIQVHNGDSTTVIGQALKDKDLKYASITSPDPTTLELKGTDPARGADVRRGRRARTAPAERPTESIAPPVATQRARQRQRKEAAPRPSPDSPCR